MRQSYKRQKNGFTLIELLVAATIIALLTTIGVVSFQSTNQRARNGKRRGDIEQVRAALELYKSDPTAGNSKYPSSGTFSSMLSVLKTAGYIADPLPQDPKNAAPYVYVYTVGAGQATYCLCGTLEGTTQGNSSDTTCGSIGSLGSGVYYCLANP